MATVPATEKQDAVKLIRAAFERGDRPEYARRIAHEPDGRDKRLWVVMVGRGGRQ
jgi:hypothetical protein